MFRKLYKICSLIIGIAMMAMLFSFTPVASVRAQEQVTIVSPEILADGSVTFRYYNPAANRVQLYIENSKNSYGVICYFSSGWPLLEMALDPTSGIWSITLPPMDPNVYNYHFNFWVPPSTRSVTIADPANPPWNAIELNSELYVPGPGAEWLSIQDVPHGRLQEISYSDTYTHTTRSRQSIRLQTMIPVVRFTQPFTSATVEAAMKLTGPHKASRITLLIILSRPMKLCRWSS